MTNDHAARAGQQQSIAWIGDSVHRVVFDGAVTDGRLAAFRSSMRAGAASPVHVHDHEDETIFVLAGAGVFWVGDERLELGAGDSVFFPRQLPHSYTFTEDSDILTVCNPAGMESFFRAAGWDLATPPPKGWAVDVDTLRTAGEANGQHVLGPPLAPEDTIPAEFISTATEP